MLRVVENVAIGTAIGVLIGLGIAVLIGFGQALWVMRDDRRECRPALFHNGSYRRRPFSRRRRQSHRPTGLHR